MMKSGSEVQSFSGLEKVSWPKFPASLETRSQDDLEIKDHKRVYSVQLKNFSQPDDSVCLLFLLA